MLICAPILFELMFYFALCNLKGNLLLLFRLNVAELQLFNWVGDWLHITLQNTVTLFWIELLEVCNSIYKYLISERLRQSFCVIVLLKPLRFWRVVRSYITSSYLLLLFLSLLSSIFAAVLKVNKKFNHLVDWAEATVFVHILQQWSYMHFGISNYVPHVSAFRNVEIRKTFIAS